MIFEWMAQHTDTVLVILAGLLIGALAELIKLIKEIWRDNK